MNTLGYTKTRTLKKIEIANIQLSEAINLFLSEKFISSLTLASASEELFAGLLSCKEESPIIEKSISLIKKTDETLVNDFSLKNKKQIIKKWNYIKNKTKHHDKKDDLCLTFNACDEAYWMIKRSLSNSKKLHVNIQNEQNFNNWVIEKICL